MPTILNDVRWLVQQTFSFVVNELFSSVFPVSMLLLLIRFLVGDLIVIGADFDACLLASDNTLAESHKDTHAQWWTHKLLQNINC